MDDNLSAYFLDTQANIDASAIDWKKEIQNIQKKIKTETVFLEKSQYKLKNNGFLKQAPKEIVSELKEKVVSTEKTLAALKKKIIDLEKYVD